MNCWSEHGHINLHLNCILVLSLLNDHLSKLVTFFFFFQKEIINMNKKFPGV